MKLRHLKGKPGFGSSLLFFWLPQLVRCGVTLRLVLVTRLERSRSGLLLVTLTPSRGKGQCVSGLTASSVTRQVQAGQPPKLGQRPGHPPGSKERAS